MEKKIVELKKNTKPKKTCGSKPASLEAYNTATPNEISEILNNSLYWYKRQPVKSDEECIDRLNEFFKHCADTGEIPTVEKMCLSLGTVRQTVFDWEKNCTRGKTRSDIIKKAKEILASIDAELVSRGKIPQVTYIFRAKNFFGMQDQQEVVLTPNNKLGEEVDKEEIINKYKKSLPNASD